MPVVNKGQTKKKSSAGGVPTTSSTGNKKETKITTSTAEEEEKKGASSASSTNSSSSSGSSSSSSSGNDSSSSDSEDGSSSSSSDSDSSSSSDNAGKDKEKKADKEKIQTGAITKNQSASRSRASSAASSVSTASSAPSSRNGSPNPRKASATSTVKSSKSISPLTSSSPSPSKKKPPKPGSTTTTKSTTAANSKSSLSKHASNKVQSAAQPNSNVSKKKGKKSEDKSSPIGSKHGNEQPSTTTSSTTGTSKVFKSGTVTNTRTIKPLTSNVPNVKKTKASSTSGSTQNKSNEISSSKTAPQTKGNKKPPVEKIPVPSKTKQGVVPEKVQKKSATTSNSGGQKKNNFAVVSTTTLTPPPIASRTRASSCSSFSSTASSSASNSSAEDEDKQNTSAKGKKLKKIKKEPLPTDKKSVAIVAAVEKIKVIAKKNTLKKKPEVAPKSEILSSAEDESEAKSDGDGKVKKKKPPQQRRPVTRRQKLGTKKTIPTTTVFNQSLLLAAANSTSSPPVGTPTKKSNLGLGVSSSSPGVAGAGGPYPGELTPLTKSSIINRRSTTNSSANSSESEEFGSRLIKNFPVSSTLSTSTSNPNNKNKYISTWDSDFSDDNFNSQISQSTANFIRVPAKTSNKPLRNLDLSLLDPDMYEPPRCPFPSCDSSGHLSGRYPSHNFLSCCPRYQGFEARECTENDQERSRRESERSRYRNILSTPGKKPPKQTSETKQWVSSVKDLKAKSTENGLVSEYDNLLWKDALAIAADKIEKEQNEGINNAVLLGNYYRLSMAVAMGRFEMKCWCESPYPEPLSQNRRLFVCEFCLKPVGSGTVLRRHCAKCVWRHPPGDEIYRKDRLSVWEVDGKKQKTYCQNLCLLAKCFLDHKTLYLDVDPFLFYVMTLADSQGCHLVGYFSKEKNSFLNYNVSCILTLPPYQRQGFGRLLIDFSYLLTRVEGKIGSPEKPLSDLGLISYRSYWKDAVLRRLCACASREINIKDLSIELGVSTADLISTLQYLGMLKYWKGKHLVLKKQDVLEEYLDRVRRRGEQRQIDSSCLRWRPYQPPPDENSSSEKS